MEKVLTGLVASSTNEMVEHGVRGVARVVPSEDRYGPSQLQPNEILITGMIDSSHEPNLLFAKAIITDWGGFTCHASMAANRFGIPCIVGTMEATKLIKNGDELLLTREGGVYILD